MKKIFSLLFLLNAVLSHAQQFTATKTPTFDQKVYADGGYFKAGENYVYYEPDYGKPKFVLTFSLSTALYSITLHNYDAGMNELKKISLDDGQKNFGPFPPKAFIYNGKLEVLYYRYMLDAELIKLYLVQIDPASLVVESTKELITMDQKAYGLFKSVRTLEDNKLFVSFSPDSSKMLVVNSNAQAIFSCIIDQQLNIARNTVIKNKAMDNFYVFDACLDNNGNKYFSYRYALDKINIRGIVTESYKNNQPKFQEFKTGDPEYGADNLYFHFSNNRSKLYIYANYYEHALHEGVLLTTIDTATFKIAKPQLFPYPDDFKDRLLKIDFAVKAKKHVSVKQINYDFLELNDGTVAFMGIPTYAETDPVTPNFTGTRYIETKRYNGPVMGVFIQPDNKATFSMIPRNVLNSSATFAAIYCVYNNQLICFYCDKEKNLTANLEDKPDYNNKFDNYVLAAAIYDSKGNILSRTKVADAPGGNNYYLISGTQLLNDHSWLLPVGQLKAGLTAFYIQYENFLSLNVK